MIEWVKIRAGEYESSDGRFCINKTWDRIYGDHWTLQDTSVPDFYKGQYNEKTLLDCKVRAEAIKDGW